MFIEPKSVDYNRTKCIGKCGDKDVLGYWVEYKWNLLCGYAYLFPSGGNDEITLNKGIYVETSQGLIIDFRKIEKNDGVKPILLPSEEPGDYYVLGEVEIVYRDEDNGEIDCAYIRVDDASFAVGNSEIQNYELEKGDYVEFNLIELELYDEGY